MYLFKKRDREEEANMDPAFLEGRVSLILKFENRLELDIPSNCLVGIVVGPALAGFDPGGWRRRVAGLAWRGRPARRHRRGTA